MALLFILSIARFFSEKQYYLSQNKEFESIRTYIHQEGKPIKIIASLPAYPTLAELSVLLPTNEFRLLSPNENKTYVPFEIKTIEMLPNINEFFFVQTIGDSVIIPDQYKVKSKLQFDKISISQIELNTLN